jgi:CrcB protein
MLLWVSVAAGGAIGSVVRHGLNVLIARHSRHAVPLATTCVNVLGCLVIGILAGAVAAHRIPLGPAWRGFVFVGLLGGFTTFSSLGLETFTLVRQGRAGLALLSVGVQLIVGLLAVFVGYEIGSRR